MRQVTINLYTFSELSETAKQRAHNDYLKTFSYPWQNDLDKTIKRIGDLFCLSFLRLEQDSYNRYSFSSQIDEEIGGLTGAKAVEWIKQALGDCDFLPGLGSFIDAEFLSVFAEFVADPDARDISDLLEAGLRRMFKCVQKDEEYLMSLEACEEEADANDREFYFDGRLYSEPS